MTATDKTVLRLREATLASGLVTPKAWNAAVRQTGGDRATASRVAKALVADEVLTAYQAEQLLDGRTKLSLGMYTIVDFIGQGGMGQVFLGTHRWMGRQCAIKVLPLEKTTQESRESFLREMRIQATLDCPYLVRAYDAGVDGRVHYLVTEYVPGTDLRRLVKSTGPLAMDQAASVIAQAAAGLAYAHGSGLIHRDIKPANLLVDPGGRTKVSDVGLAMLGDDDADPRAGKIVGTADYLSPEQIRTPEAVGPASDLYSLGCTLYYAVTGKVPFPGGDARSKCHRHLHEQAWNPRKFNPELSDDFIDAIGMLMEKDPKRRPRDATEVVRRMKAWTGGRMLGDEASARSRPGHVHSGPEPPRPLRPLFRSPGPLLQPPQPIEPRRRNWTINWCSKRSAWRRLISTLSPPTRPRGWGKRVISAASRWPKPKTTLPRPRPPRPTVFQLRGTLKSYRRTHRRPIRMSSRGQRWCPRRRLRSCRPPRSTKKHPAGYCY